MSDPKTVPKQLRKASPGVVWEAAYRAGRAEGARRVVLAAKYRRREIGGVYLIEESMLDAALAEVEER